MLTADNPEAVWFDMSAQERDLVREELNDGTVQISAKKDEGSVSAKVTYSGCWTRAIEATFKGGVTKRKMFSVGQRTEVCAKLCLNGNGKTSRATEECHA